jgi:acyl-CoA thioester hydrolase
MAAPDLFAPPLERAFTLKLRALPQDIDELGHVSNLVYLRWVQDVAVAASAHRGFDFAAYQRMGMFFVVRKHELEYLAQVREGEAVDATTWIASWRGPSAERRTLLTRADGKAVARAVTHWVLIGAEDGRPKRIPEALSRAFGGPGE